MFVRTPDNTRLPAAYSRRVARWALVVGLALVAGCVQEMSDQPRYEPLEKSDFFPDGRASRPFVAGTIARGQLQLDDHLYRGLVAGQPAQTFPFEITPAVLARGQERYKVFCTPCHDQLGTGNGMIVRRGYHKADSFHTAESLQRPVGRYFDVITNGHRLMPDYASQIRVRDRWAIIAYIRALQYSQSVPIDEVPREERERLEGLPQ